MAIAWLAAYEPGIAACGSKRYCTEMTDCAEVAYFFSQCGLGRLDGDSDGVPCETLCGDSHEAFQRRLGVQSRQPLMPTTFECGTKRTCSQMDSCEEAKFHLQTCGLDRLDGDGDGVPCASLCR